MINMPEDAYDVTRKAPTKEALPRHVRNALILGVQDHH
jgi:hypothetical protein